MNECSNHASMKDISGGLPDTRRQAAEFRKRNRTKMPRGYRFQKNIIGS